MQGLVPKHPIIMSLASMPFYVLLGTPGLLLFNIFGCIILIVLIFKLNCLFHYRLTAFVVTILYATVTLFLEYTYNYSPDIFSTVLVTGGLYLILRERFYAGAFILVLSIFAKLPNMLLVIIILLYAGMRIWKKEAADENDRHRLRSKGIITVTTALSFLLALTPFLYTNTMLFGSPIVTGYQRTAMADASGQMVLVDHTAKFNQPLLQGIYTSLFDPRNGVIPTNPVFVLALVGMARIGRMRPQDKALLILLICLIQFTLFAKYDEWFTSFISNRFLMTTIALSSIFTGNFLSYLATGFSFQDPILEPNS